MDSSTPAFPRLNAPAEGYVFVITYGRSGSTLVQNLLNGIDGYCIRGENNSTLRHLSEAWSAMSSVGPMSGVRTAHVETNPTHPWYGAELTDPAQFGKTLANVFVRDILKLPPGTRVGGFKEIRYLMPRGAFNKYMKFILDVFPNPRFVFNTRNPVDVAKSGWWADVDTDRVMKQLGEAESVWTDFMKRHPAKCLKLHYDDYVARPECFDALFDFLGEPRDPALVERVLDTKLSHMKEGKDGQAGQTLG